MTLTNMKMFFRNFTNQVSSINCLYIDIFNHVNQVKLNDLVKDLKRTLDIKEFFPIAEVKIVEETSKKSTSDIRSDLQDIVFETDREVKLHRNNTKNFDALRKKSVLGKI